MKFIKAEFEKNFEQWSKSAFRTTDVITNAVGRGFNSERILQKIKAKINWARLNTESWVMVVNDFDFTLTKMFYDRGITNIVFMTTAALSDKEVNKYFFDIIYKRPKFLNYFKDGKLPWKAILSMEEVPAPILKGKKIKWGTKIDIKLLTGEFMQSKEINLVIANPPYGAIGANITYTIIDKVNFKQYINLLPANDYDRNTDKNLFKYVRNMEAINDGFKGDASVTTHLCEIVKEPADITTIDFEISQYIDRQLDKYFTENSKRTHYAIDNATYKPKLKNFETNFDLRRCLFIGKRYISDEHIPYTKNCAGYKVNIERTITHAELIALSAKSEQANGNVGDFILAQFNTVQEQNNITNFLYSTQGAKFFAKVVIAMNLDSYAPLKKFIPKVDWTRSWTVEELLADYGYTEDEIEAIIKDLSRFKGRED